MHPPKKILVSPLNWGLGHASRCIPIIKELILQGASVYLASDGRALHLLKKEFPDLPFFELPRYGITYRSKHILLNIISGLPRLIQAVYRENRLIDQLIRSRGINGVISDNRLGCFSRKVPSVFITHQINLILPTFFLQWMGRRVNYFFINNYDECWVPDVEGYPNLSGVLSHQHPISSASYIGALSRMENYPVNRKYDVVAVLSGPEPQRTIFEKVIIEQAGKLPYEFLIVQGKTEIEKHHRLTENIEVVTSMTSEALNTAILSGDLFLGRAGYSTIMDLNRLGKPAILVPTPGQTEQEYLGCLFSNNDIFHVESQDKLELKEAIPEALKKKNTEHLFATGNKMKMTIKAFLEKCG